MTLPLTNTLLFDELMEYVRSSRTTNKIGAFYGYSGYGKTQSAIRTANQANALYLCIGASWTRSIFAEKLANCVKAPVGKTIGHTIQEVIKRMQGTSTPMIIDEFDIGVEKKLVEIVREIHDECSLPIIIIGEEKLAHKLEEFERFHNRVVKWQPAQRASFEDAKAIIQANQPDIMYNDDVIQHVTDFSKGILRRIIANANILAEHANLNAIDSLTMDNTKSIRLFTGKVATRMLGE